MAPQLRGLFGGGRRPPTREEELESLHAKRLQAIRIQEGAHTDQPRVRGHILVNGQWVPDPNYQQVPPTGSAAVLSALVGQRKPEIADAPTVEVPEQRPRLESVLSPLPSDDLRPYAGLGLEETERIGREPWTRAALQRSGVRRSDEQRVGELGKKISRLDLKREGMMEPAERPKGAGALIEALFSLGSTGDVFDIRDARERKREKALGVLSERQKELETRREGVRGRLEGVREEEAARAEVAKRFELMDAQIEGVIAQTANVSRPTPGNVIPDLENPGKFIREYRTSDGTVVFTTRELKPAIDARSPEGIEAQKELLDYSDAITQRQFDRQMARSQTDAQKTALAMILQMSKDRLAAAKANADAVFQNYQATPDQMADAAAILTKETQDNGSMMWMAMEAIGSNPFGPWNNMFQQGGGGGQFEEGDTATGPNGEKMAYRSGRWMRLQ